MSSNGSMLNNASVPVDTIYQKYHGVGFSWSLLWLYTPQFLFSLIGILLNSSLVYVTWKCRSILHNSFNVLIAIESLVSALWEYSYVFPWFIALFGINYISADLCFFLQIPSNLGVNIQNLTMFYISLERISCILFPIWSKHTKQQNVRKYLIVLNLISMAYGLVNNVIVYLGLVEFKDREVMCFLGDNRGAFSKWYSFRTLLGLELLTLSTYLIIWLLMLRGYIKRIKITSTYNMHILKSLSVIMLFIFFGWALNGLSPFYYPLLNLSREETVQISTIMVDFTLISSASNAPVLYIFSGEYRRCFRKVFPRLPGGGQPSTTVQVQQAAAIPVANIMPKPVANPNYA